MCAHALINTKKPGPPKSAGVRNMMPGLILWKILLAVLHRRAHSSVGVKCADDDVIVACRLHRHAVPRHKPLYAHTHAHTSLPYARTIVFPPACCVTAHHTRGYLSHAHTKSAHFAAFCTRTHVLTCSARIGMFPPVHYIVIACVVCCFHPFACRRRRRCSGTHGICDQRHSSSRDTRALGVGAHRGTRACSYTNVYMILDT